MVMRKKEDILDVVKAYAKKQRQENSLVYSGDDRLDYRVWEGIKV